MSTDDPAPPERAAQYTRVFRRVVAWGTALLAVMAVLQHLTFHAMAYDMGIFHQVLWNTSRGRWFESSLKHHNYLGDHFSPLLALLAPLEWLPFPVVAMLVVQSAVVAFTAWQVYQLARLELGARGDDGQAMAAVIGVACFLHPMLWSSALFDVHPEVFMAAALARGLLELARGRQVWAAPWFLACLAGKEDSALLLAPLGVVLAFRRERRWFGVALAIGSLAWMAVAVFVIMPAFRPPARSDAPWFYLGRYSHLGGSFGEVARFCVLHPLSALFRSATPLKVWSLLLLLATFAFAPLAGGVRLLAVLPFAAEHWLSLREPQFRTGFQYLVPAVPVLAWAAVAGAPRLMAPRLKLAMGCALAVGGLSSPGWRLVERGVIPRPQHAALWEAIRLVPDGVSACGQNRVGAHLAARLDYDFCVLWEMERPQYEYYGWPQTSTAEYRLFDMNGDDGAPSMATRAAALERAGAQVLFKRDGVVLLRVDREVLARAEGR